MKTSEKNYRHLLWWEQRKLEDNGCSCNDWSRVLVSDRTDITIPRNITFEGDIRIGALEREHGGQLENSRLVNCILGDNVCIADCSLIEFEPEASCGVGTEVCVLDETGSRAVTIYPGLSAQTALLMAREPKWMENHLKPILSDYLFNYQPALGIGDGSRLLRCGLLHNVSVGRGITVEGVESLRNGSIINNAPGSSGYTYVGAGVDAANFIFEDCRVTTGTIVRNCYVGQGVVLENGFTAHDSLFFANSTFENGEACALFAGPYSVSMHKSTLIIGCQTSFMNAGSGTNQSNHMYKLGPVHWGILERGVKTSSFSYIMLGAKIGAFSLLMGQHKTHPDSSQFPFSYLFGDEKGATVVVPGVMLRSCGLLRDEKKWPARDRRLKARLPLHDRVVFDVLNPQTVDRMLTACDEIARLLAIPADDDRYIRYKGMKFTRASLERARYLYEMAIYKYLYMHTHENGFPMRESGTQAAEWVDLAGQLMPRNYLNRAMSKESVEEIEDVFDDAFNHYKNLERAWIAARFSDKWRRPAEVIKAYAEDFDRMAEEDRRKYLEDLAAQNEMLRL